MCGTLLALGKQRQTDLSEFVARLDYRMSSGIASVTQRNPVVNNNLKNKTVNAMSMFRKLQTSNGTLQSFQV